MANNKFTYLFALSVFRDHLGVEETLRNRLAKIILQDEQRRPTPR